MDIKGDTHVESDINVLSDSGRLIFEVTNFVVISSFIGVLGIVGNVINIIIFYNQGFSNTVNIGFFGLAISDLCCIIALEWISVCMNPLIVTTDTHWIPAEVMYLSGAWPHACFGRITSYITSYITAERYLCIALPLKVKEIITPRLTTLVLCLLYLLNLMTLVPEYATSYLGWNFLPTENKTCLSLSFTSNRLSVEGIVYVLHSLFGMGSFVAVIIFTSVLVTRLRQTSKWRISATSGFDRIREMPNRDRKTMKMIVLIATILIVCYTPGAVIAMTTFIVGSEFSIKGVYVNIFMAVWSVAVSFQVINSSINIILYYKMSSKYRETFHEIFSEKMNIGKEK